MKILPLSYINILIKDNGARRKHGRDKCKISAENSEGEKPRIRTACKWEDNIIWFLGAQGARM
jgi:hypothetical protein